MISVCLLVLPIEVAYVRRDVEITEVAGRLWMPRYHVELIVHFLVLGPQICAAFGYIIYS